MISPERRDPEGECSGCDALHTLKHAGRAKRKSNDHSLRQPGFAQALNNALEGSGILVGEHSSPVLQGVLGIDSECGGPFGSRVHYSA